MRTCGPRFARWSDYRGQKHKPRYSISVCVFGLDGRSERRPQAAVRKSASRARRPSWPSCPSCSSCFNAVSACGVTADAVGIDRPTSNITNSIYKFTLGSSGFQIGPTPPADQFQTQNNYNFVETLSWVRGKHTWRFGGEYTRVNIDKQFPQVFNGQLFFVNTAGVAPTESEPVGVGGLTDFQKVLAGQVDFSFGGGFKAEPVRLDHGSVTGIGRNQALTHIEES